MRTTITLDDDVAAELNSLRARQAKPFRQLINEVLRAGLSHLERVETGPRGPFTRVVDLGRPRLPDVDDVSEALAIVEGDSYR